MKKIKIGSVEALGYIGMILWVAVILLRGNYTSDNSVYLFIIGSLPNMAAAWLFTMLGKWMVIFLFKRKYTLKIHLAVCGGILAIALLSEIIHAVFFASPFDIYDMLVTVIAQTVMFFIPVLTKDKYFSSYEE